MDSDFFKEKMLLARKEEAGIPLQAKEYDFLADHPDIEEEDEEDMSAKCIFMAKISPASSDTELILELMLDLPKILMPCLRFLIMQIIIVMI